MRLRREQAGRGDSPDQADVEQLRRENERLSEKSRYLNVILENVDVPLFLKTIDYRYVLVNRHFEVLASADLDKIIGATDFDIFDEPIARLFREQDEQVARKAGRCNYEETIALPSGELSFVTSKFPVFDEHGRLTGVGGVCADVTKLKKAEDALRVSESKFHSIIDNTPLGMLVYELRDDSRLVLVDANPAADRILQTDCKQLTGMSIEEAFPNLAQTEVPTRFRAIARGADSWHTEEIVYGDERVEGIFEVNAFRTAPHTTAVFFADVSRKHSMQQERLKLQKLESLGVLAGGIAHDFNNVLTSILGTAALAVLQLGSGAPKARALLAEVERAATIARNLTHQLLTFSKGGAPVLSPAAIDEVIRSSAEFVLRGRNSHCELDLPDDLWPVEIDVGQISQVVQNVLINASESMPAGGRIQVSCRNLRTTLHSELPLSAGDYVEILVADRGCGITDEALGKVFDPYFTTKPAGTGLGLAITHSIITQHDGHIRIAARAGGGTAVTIYLPAGQAARPAVTKESAAGAKPYAGKARVLVMDDQELVRDVAKGMLEILGHEPTLACNGTEAVELYATALASGHPFDLVIVDLTVPGELGGMGAAKKILRIDPEARLVVSSGYSNDPIMASFHEHGFCAALAKPYLPQDLSETIRRVLL